MRGAAKSVRPSKRDVIVISDDDSTDEQPAVKIVNKEKEPVPSAEVIKLQQKVTKLEGQFKGACRVARAAELRAEAAEERLDSKNGIKDAFDAEKRRADDLEKRLIEMSLQNEALKTEITVMKREHQKRVCNLTVQQLEQRQQDRTRIDVLTNRLAHYEKAPPPVEIDHPTNLFQLCPPDSSGAISYDNAHGKMLSVVTELEGESIHDKLNRRFDELPKLHSLILICPPCGAILSKTAVVEHFLSDGHQQMLSDRKAAVSRVALNFWAGKLQLQQPAAKSEPPEAAAAGVAIGKKPPQVRAAAGSNAAVAAVPTFRRLW